MRIPALSFGFIVSSLMAAADVTDSLTGASGWVGTVSLSSVLAWLFFKYIPAKDQQHKEFHEAKDKQINEMMERNNRSTKELVDSYNARIKEIVDSHNTLLDQLVHRVDQTDKERRTDFQSALAVVVNHCEREGALQRDMINKDMAESTEAIKDLRLTMEDLRKVLLPGYKGE